ncbi:MAG: sigma-70 family RNA polymerase sigma factor [Oscillospiraceae bacterium]|nr:sigma-70 family RNA polymerase sigma factor [Oscillospiraceae bacterium]
MEQDMCVIVDRYGRLVYGIAMAHMKQKEDAEDVFQEVFLTYARKQPAFASDKAGGAWFAKTTINHCRMLWRSKGRHQTVLLDESAETAQQETEDIALQDAIERLPETLRQVILMYYYTELSEKEIAKALRITENAVRIRMSRARKALEKILADE